MKKIGIIVGEDADLPDQIIKKYRISTFPFVLDWDKYEKNKNIYKLMRKATGRGPKTSQPAPAVFKNLFEKSLREFNQIIAIIVSSKFSGTYNSCVQALKSLPKEKAARIHIVDSETSSGAEGLLVLRTIKMIESNSTPGQILAELEADVKKAQLIGVFSDPKWLVAGGRISPIKGVLVKNMLKGGFRPVLTIRDGEIVVKKIQMNAGDGAAALFNQFREENKKGEASVVITHADCPSEAASLAKMLEKFFPSVKIEYVHEISPVVGSHLGPGTLLLSWIPND